jgi:hypothetical protein
MGSLLKASYELIKVAAHPRVLICATLHKECFAERSCFAYCHQCCSCLLDGNTSLGAQQGPQSRLHLLVHEHIYHVPAHTTTWADYMFHSLQRLCHTNATHNLTKVAADPRVPICATLHNKDFAERSCLAYCHQCCSCLLDGYLYLGAQQGPQSRLIKHVLGTFSMCQNHTHNLCKHIWSAATLIKPANQINSPPKTLTKP